MTDDSEQERWTDEIPEYHRENTDAEEALRRLVGQANSVENTRHRNDRPEVFAEIVRRRIRGGEGEREEALSEAAHRAFLLLDDYFCYGEFGASDEYVHEVYRSLGEAVREDHLIQPLDAAPDTEGREAALVKASEFHEGPYTHLAHRGDTEAVCGYEVVAWGDEPDPDATEPICAECLRQIPHPEEAGGEGEALADRVEMAAAELKAEIRDRYHADHEDGIHPAQQGKYEAAMELVEDLHRAADRLRRPPEGAGGYNGPEIPEGVLWSVAAAMDEAWHSGYQQARDDLRTGREERDDG